MSEPVNRRILIIDDNPSIHDDFRKILEDRSCGQESLDAKEALLFGATQQAAPAEHFEIDSAYQGEEGLERIVYARDQGRPFALTFVDVRMPPGWDGVETIERVWPADPDLQVVICSAYSDYSAQDILDRLGVSDRLLMLRKPCDSAEILLIATALVHKWNLAQSARAGWKSCEEPAVSK
ncbi:MAG: response regulator [Planctomycetes bacterium]|nr:response regulator [Planctomycetota bacterium]